MPDALAPLVDGIRCGELEDATIARSPEDEVLNLHDLFRIRLLRYAASLGLKPHDAEDVIQEVFLALFKHLQAERPRNNLPGWIFRVTHHLALKRRVQSRGNELIRDGREYEVAAEHLFSPEDEVIFDERQRRLRSIFLVLPEIDRLCLQLRSEGLKYREIAGVLNISLGSVHKSLSRSLSRLF